MTTLCRLLLVVLVARCCHAIYNKHSSFTALHARRAITHLGPGDVSSSEPHRRALTASTQRARTLEAILIKVRTEWNITVGKHGVEPNAFARLADEHDLTAHLRQVLEVADKLLQIGRACLHGSAGSNLDAAGADGVGRVHCSGAAPELLHGGTAPFLASLLRTYPRGPSTREAMASWLAASTAFLGEHQRLQRAQRQEAQRAADAATDLWNGANPSRQPAEAGIATAKAAAAPGGSGAAAAATGGSTDTHTDIDDYSESSSRRELAEESNDGGGPDDDGGDDGEEDEGGDSEAGDSGARSAASDFLDKFTGIQYGGLPLVRRVMLAQLLLGWMTAVRQGDDQDVSPVAEEELSRVVTLLYEIHVESVAQRALMEYFHISKAGGTSWTAAAAATGCQRPRANAARDRDLDDDCRWINGSLIRDHGINVRRTSVMQVCSRFDVTERQTQIRTCVGRLRHSLRSGFQYISNEYTLHGGLKDMYDTHICPQFVNVISIREPLERLVSNIKYMLVRLRSTLFRRPPASDLFPELFCNASAERWEQYAPPVADNYNIRTLVGEREFHAPLYGIGEAHEAIAKQLLLQYDLVLDLNAGDEASDLLMREGLGWSKTLAEVRIWTIDKMTKKSGLDLVEDCRVGDLTPLLKRQVYDQRWYSFGRTLSRLDHLFLSAASQLGQRPWPTSWAQSVPGTEQLSEKDVADRCGLLGASQALRGA